MARELGVEGSERVAVGAGGGILVSSPPLHLPPPPHAPVLISRDSNVLRGCGSTRGDGTTRRGKQEGGAMRGKVITSQRIERRRWQRGDTTSSRGKIEGFTSRGNVTTSQHLERWWHDVR